MAGCISVGSPTMANETGGSPGNTLSIPSLPETSSSHEARYRPYPYLWRCSWPKAPTRCSRNPLTYGAISISGEFAIWNESVNFVCIHVQTSKTDVYKRQLSAWYIPLLYANVKSVPDRSLPKGRTLMPDQTELELSLIHIWMGKYIQACTLWGIRQNSSGLCRVREEVWK